MKRLNIKYLISERRLYSQMLVVLLAFLVYANTLGHGFVFDDEAVLKSNTYVQKGLDGLGVIFSKGSWSGYGPERDLHIYRPLKFAVLALQYEAKHGDILILS